MPHVRHSVHVDASPHEAFALCADLGRHVEWQGGLEAVEVLTPGPTATGSRAVETRRMGGRRTVSEYEITECNPPERLAFRTLNGPIRPAGAVDFASEGDGCRMSFELDFVGVGMGRLIAPLVALDARRRRLVERDLEAFAALLASD